MEPVNLPTVRANSFQYPHWVFSFVSSVHFVAKLNKSPKKHQ